MFTLEYAGVEMLLSLPAGYDPMTPTWSLANPVITAVNQGAGTLTCDGPGESIDTPPTFPYRALVIVRGGRSGSGTSWSGGGIVFQGRRFTAKGTGKPDDEGRSYVFKDAWWDLESTVFQQQCNIVSSTPAAGKPVVLGEVLTSDLILMQAFNTKKYITIQQICEIIQFAAASPTAPPGTTQGAGIAIQPGSELIDPSVSRADVLTIINTAIATGVYPVAPLIDAPTYQVKDMTCAECIKNCLRWSPDAATWFDYSTTPPTFHVTRRAAVTPVTLPFGPA